MRFEPLQVSGAVRIVPQPHEDERGLFSRIFCEEEFSGAGLPVHFPQMSISVNRRKGTVRGMHYQAEPHGEVKVVRCARGAIHDILIDLRRRSPTFGKSVAVELTQRNLLAVFIPPGIAHGFQTLEDDTEVHYMMDHAFVPQSARGVRWNDPAFQVEWPLEISVLSERDATYPDFDR